MAGAVAVIVCETKPMQLVDVSPHNRLVHSLSVGGVMCVGVGGGKGRGIATWAPLEEMWWSEDGICSIGLKRNLLAK